MVGAILLALVFNLWAFPPNGRHQPPRQSASKAQRGGAVGWMLLLGSVLLEELFAVRWPD